MLCSANLIHTVRNMLQQQYAGQVRGMSCGCLTAWLRYRWLEGEGYKNGIANGAKQVRNSFFSDNAKCTNVKYLISSEAKSKSMYLLDTYLYVLQVE